MPIRTAGDPLKGIPVRATCASDTTRPIYTWEQVAEHNTAKSAWVYIGKKVYDITEWVDRHPGGRSVLLLVAGRDATDLFTSYHPFSARPQQILEKYEIGEIASSEFPQYADDSGFYAECRREVGAYFARTGRKPKDPLPGLWRLAFMLAVAAVTYVCTYTTLAGEFRASVRFVLAIVFGVFQALPLLHAMHDCSHTAFGPNEKWWLGIGKLTMDWFGGASLTSWHNQHVLGHHVYTNVLGVDPDLPMKLDGDLRRVSRVQRWAVHYRWQHFYMFMLYGLLAIKFRMQDLTDTLWSQTNGAIRVNMPAGEYVHQAIVKTWFVIWRFVIPLYHFKMSIPLFVVCWFASELATGYFLAFNFQVSHVSPDVVWPELAHVGPKTHFQDEWAIAQVRTTVDYAHGSWIAAFLCGALNYQTVHHLFPCVSQYHYPALAPIVQRVCAKWHVRYNLVPTFGEAFAAHWRHLRTLGNECAAVSPSAPPPRHLSSSAAADCATTATAGQ